jgi:predicted secreted protein
MSTQAKSAYATTLTWNGTEVGELQSIAGPAQKVKAIDVTNMDSGGVAEFVAGVLDAGTITVEGNFTDASGQAGLMTDFAAKTLRTLVITTFSSHTFTASAYCVDLSTDFKVTDRVVFKATFQITGSVTFS